MLAMFRYGTSLAVTVALSDSLSVQTYGSGIQLTGAGGNQEGNCWYLTALDVRSFTIQYQFYITYVQSVLLPFESASRLSTICSGWSSPPADGISFIIQNYSPYVTGGYGASECFVSSKIRFGTRDHGAWLCRRRRWSVWHSVRPGLGDRHVLRHFAQLVRQLNVRLFHS